MSRPPRALELCPSETVLLPLPLRLLALLPGPLLGALVVCATACGGRDAEGGATELTFAGGALDGSEDAALEAAGPDEPGATAAGPKRAKELVIDYETPIEQLVEAMGLSYVEATAMIQLPEDVIRQLAAARVAQLEFDASDTTPPQPLAGGRLAIRFRHLALDALDDPEFEALMDSLLETPEERAERAESPEFPEPIRALHGQDVALGGYMIPIEWNDAHVLEFMLVRDLLACCFGGAPQPDEWVQVRMVKGKEARYFPFVPVVVHGRLTIAGIADGAGYTAGCYHLAATKVLEED